MKDIWLIVSLILKNFALTVNAHKHYTLTVLFSLYQEKLPGPRTYISPQMKSNWQIALHILQNFLLAFNAFVHHFMLIVVIFLYQEILSSDRI